MGGGRVAEGTSVRVGVVVGEEGDVPPWQETNNGKPKIKKRTAYTRTRINWFKQTDGKIAHLW